MASRYWVNGGNGLWNSTTNWSATPGGASGASVPTSADDVTFDGNGNSNSTISANITVLSLKIESGYTSTMTHNAVITIGSGGWIMNNSHTIAGSSSITLNSSCTITTNSQVWPNNITFSGVSVTKTIDGDFTINGSLITGNTSANTITPVSSSIITVNSGIITGSNGVLSGTCKIVVKGGSISTSSALRVPTELDGNITISGTFHFNNATLTYLSGTITTTGSTLTISSASTILDTNGVIWDNIIFASTIVITLSSDLTASGSLTINNTSSITVNSSNIFCNGLVQGSNASIAGSSNLYIKGGTWSSGASNSILSLNTFFDGNVIVLGNVYYRTGTLTYLSGAITTTGSTLNLMLGCNLDSDGMSWDNITLSNTSGQTYTLESVLRVSGILKTGNAASTLFNGGFGWEVHTFQNYFTGALTISLEESVEYIITDLLEVYWSRNGSAVSFTSSDASIKSKLTLKQGALCKCLANFTRIDSSGGRTINTFSGTVTDCINIRQFFDLGTIGSPI